MKTVLNSGRRLAVAGTLALTALAFAATGAGASGDAARLESLESQAAALGGQIDTLSTALSGFMPRGQMQPIGDIAPPMEVAQSSRDVGSINVRLGQLEEQIRILTGQVEGLQFQMTQFQTFIERLQEDYEFRFQQLEGGGLGKTSAAPQSGGAMPSGGLPQDSNAQVLDFNSGAGFDSSDSLDLTGPDIVIDPAAEGFELDAPEQPLGTLSTEDLQLSDQPLDLNFDSNGLVNDEDAAAQYQAGYDAVVRGDYDFAEDQFRQFISLFPDHPQAPDATNWLGETLILRGEYDEAADILLTGFESYPNSSRAPDMLLKLGIALAGAGEQETACRTFSEVLRRYPDVSASFRSRLSEEMGKAQC